MDNTFTQLLEHVAEDLHIMPSILDIVAKADPESIIREIVERFAKDVQRAKLAMPSVVARERALGLAVVVAYQAQRADPTEENVKAFADAVEAQARFGKETIAIFDDYAHRSTHPAGWDPFHAEREDLRIYAKRNEMDPRWQDALGVSDGTATEYPADYVTTYLSGALAL